MEHLYTFRRKENKYLISPQQQNDLMQRIGQHLTADEYGESTVCNTYLDTPTRRLIRDSIEATDDRKPYKEKLRIRSYGIPEEDGRVFIELKKKFKGIWRGYSSATASTA